MGSVLVADDDETIRSILEHKLSKEGFDVYIHEDGEDARKALSVSESDVDLVVLDVMMPRLNGKRLLRMIRGGELEVDSDIPVVMLTSRGREDDVLDGLESGADEYMTKPFSPNELVARVRRLVEKETGG